jgi:glycine dehydrogenase
MYAQYHGPDGLRVIAQRAHNQAVVFAEAAKLLGHEILGDGSFFDTVRVNVKPAGVTAEGVLGHARAMGLNLRPIDDFTVGVSFDETTTQEHLEALVGAFGDGVSDKSAAKAMVHDIATRVAGEVGSMYLGEEHLRTSEFMTHPVFNTYKSETEMMRYLHELEMKDLSLNHSMISLGSCTMKLNAATEMIPVTWPKFTECHPFSPWEQVEGYRTLLSTLHAALCEITGFDAMSSQPNSGATGEYAGLVAIREYQKSVGEGHRNVCLIPVSAHGTNPASAVMAGMRVVTVKSDTEGRVDLDDLAAKIDKHKDNLSAFMITYPSTFGVFEASISQMLDMVHEAGGQVYMDGANMNAQVGLTSPGAIGADVCHLNLHKTFCIPHGGGGPGVGSIGVKEHLAPHLPGHSVVMTGGAGKNVTAKADGQIAAAPFGSALILPIPWMYIRMMGADGLKRATQVAVLNANYMARRLKEHFHLAFTSEDGWVAHEFIIDLRPLKAASGITEEDVAKRLIDYGFHAPTMSWPVPGTLMVEPTESESKEELDRFCDAMIAIRQEIQDVMDGKLPAEDNPLVNAPHTAADVMADDWSHPYSRQQAAYPAAWTRTNKFWPSVSRVDNVYGDRHLVCSCPPLDLYADDEED